MSKARLIPLASAAFALAFSACQQDVISPEAVIDAPQFQATVNHFEDKIPLPSFSAFIPCANGGLGELAVVTNPYLHFVFQTVIDASGGVHTSGHAQPIGNWDGIGQVTGDVYQPTGITRDNFNVTGSGLPIEATFINNFRWIGPGPDNNLLVHTTFHFTITANGVTADVLNTTVDCK